MSPQQQNQVYYPHTESHCPPNDSIHKLDEEPLFITIKKFLRRKYNPGVLSNSIPQIIPSLKLFKSSYSFTDVWVDALAGATLSTVLIPQSLSYAVLAGLSAQYGLYPAFFAPLCYFLFGTTRELSVGPFALVSIIVAEIITGMYPELSSLNETDPTQALSLRLGYTMTLTFISGIWLVLMAILKLGWIIDLVSTPAVNGLIMATALSVSASQLGSLFSVNTGQGSALQCLIGLFQNISKTNFASLFIGTFGIIVLILADLWSTKKKFKIPPPVQIGLVISVTAISALFNFEKTFNLPVVGTIPRGFLASTLPSIPSLFSYPAYFANGFLVAVVGFVISSSVSTQMGEENKYKVNFNSELFSLGMASLVGSFVNSYASSASLSRTAVVNACKPRTSLWNLWSSAIILLVIFVLGPLLYHLPKCILASVVIGAFRGQFLKYDQGWIIFKKSPVEGLVYFATLLMTLLVSIQAGLIAAFVSSLFSIILQQASFKPTFLLQIPSTQRFDNWKRFDLGPYYNYIEEVESQGGLNKRRAPRHSRRVTDVDSELYGTGDNNTAGGYEQQFDDDTSTDAPSNSDGLSNFDLYNLNSPGTNPPHSSSHGDGSQYERNLDSLNTTNGNTSPHAQIQALLAVQNPTVAVLHIGGHINFLNSNPISEYLHRYIEMHREFHKKTRLLTQPPTPAEQFTSPTSPNSVNTPSSVTPQYNPEEYRIIAPQTLRSLLLDPKAPITPSSSQEQKMRRVQQVVQQSNSTQHFQGNNNSAIPTNDNSSMDNIFGSSDIPPHSLLSNGSAIGSPNSHSNVFMNTRSGTSGDIVDDDYDGDGNNHEDNSEYMTQQNPLKFSSLNLHSLSHTKFSSPPLSHSTLSSYQLLSMPQKCLFSALVYDTMVAFDDAKFAQIEFCVILDSIQSVDLTGESMLNKLRTQFPFVLFLFTTPSQQFCDYLYRNGKGNGKNGINGAFLPSGFVLNDIFVATHYAKYIVDMSIASRATIAEEDSLKRGQDPQV